MTISILDEGGRPVRSLRGTKQAGINRVWWDLRYEASREPRLRTPPQGHPHVTLPPSGWRPLIEWTYPRESQIRPLAAPGRYTVRLRAGDRAMDEALIVKKDPHSAGTEADIQRQVKLSLDVRDTVGSLTDTIDRIELIRRQLYDLIAVQESRGQPDREVVGAARKLDAKLIDVEEHLFQTTTAGGSLDAIRNGVRLYAKLVRLGGDIGSSDFPPTRAELEVYDLLKNQLAQQQTELKRVIDTDGAAFNKLLLKQGTLLTEIARGPIAF